MASDPEDLRLDAHLLLRTQHAWIRGRLDMLSARSAELPEPARVVLVELRAAVRQEMAEEETTLLPYVEARSCRGLARPRQVEALVAELRAGHLRLDDLAARLRTNLASAGSMAGPVHELLDDLAEHHLEEGTRLLDVLLRLARDTRTEPRAGRRGTRFARTRAHEPG